MSYTGETGDEHEIEAVELETDETEFAIEAELVDDEVATEDDGVVIDAVEDDVDVAVVLDAEAAAAEDAAVEGADAAADSEDADDSEDPEGDEDETGAEPRAVRHRHPAAAASLAKRVAMDRSARIAVGSLVAVAMMFLFVFPTRSYLAQQGQVRDARNSVQELRLQNEKLAREAERLETPEEIQKLARSQFNMVFEGEEAYNVVPPDGTPTTTTEP